MRALQFLAIEVVCFGIKDILDMSAIPNQGNMAANTKVVHVDEGTKHLDTIRRQNLTSCFCRDLILQSDFIFFWICRNAK